MRFSARSKVGGLLSLFVMITIVSAFALNGLFFHSTATRAAGGQSYSASKGQVRNSQQMPVCCSKISMEPAASTVRKRTSALNSSHPTRVYASATAS